MLVRFVVENFYSFGDRKEFTTIPNKRLKTLNHHRYKCGHGDFEVLKLSSVYGANGAGKSNLVRLLFILQDFVLEDPAISRMRNTKFRFNEDKNANQILAVEFISEGIGFYYGIELSSGRVVTEELYRSGLGTKEDELIYVRKTDSKGVTNIDFFSAFEQDHNSQVLKEILLQEFVKPNELILKLLSNRDNKLLADTKKAFSWFSEALVIISPTAKPRGLPYTLDTNPNFRNYANEMMCSFNLGIKSIYTENMDILDFFGKDDAEQIESIKRDLDRSPDSMFVPRGGVHEGEIVVVKEDESYLVKRLRLQHIGGGKEEVFDLQEESDGTIRLLEFVPAFRSILEEDKVYFIDEIERSIHPLLIKELIRKFSSDSKTKGQLFFTTHESNLLDQEIFRQDEIWFAEKDTSGSTDLYSLGDFKEHKTIDIRKGYLSGRYGSIPFLGNLEDLNWHNHDTNE